MHPLFFLPDERALSASLIEQHGLDRLVSNPQCRQTYAGPDGAGGLLVADGSVPAEQLAFHPEQQTWSPRFGRSSLVGTWTNNSPSPDELLREKPIAGADVKLLDGRTWHVPMLRQWKPDSLIDWTCRLPRVMQQCASSGQWLVTEVIPQYRDLWQHSMRIANALFEQLSKADSAELDWTDLFEFAVAALAVNYRIDASVLSHLRILEPETAVEIVQAALDWGTLRASLKNALSRPFSGGTNSESGAPPQTAD